MVLFAVKLQYFVKHFSDRSPFLFVWCFSATTGKTYYYHFKMAEPESMDTSENIEKLTARKRKKQEKDQEPEVVEKLKKIECEIAADDTEAPPVKKITAFCVNEFRSQLHAVEGLKCK